MASITKMKGLVKNISTVLCSHLAAFFQQIGIFVGHTPIQF